MKKITTNTAAIKTLEELRANTTGTARDSIQNLLDYFTDQEIKKELSKKPNELKRYRTAVKILQQTEGGPTWLHNTWTYVTGEQVICDGTELILLNAEYHLTNVPVLTDTEKKPNLEKILNVGMKNDTNNNYDKDSIHTLIAKGNTRPYKKNAPDEPNKNLICYKGHWFCTERVAQILTVLGSTDTICWLTEQNNLYFETSYGTALLPHIHISSEDPQYQQKHPDLYLL